MLLSPEDKKLLTIALRNIILNPEGVKLLNESIEKIELNCNCGSITDVKIITRIK